MREMAWRSELIWNAKRQQNVKSVGEPERAD